MSRRARKAFTLIEVVMAVTILALAMAISAGVVAGVLAGTQRIQAEIDFDSFAAEIDDLVADDLAFLAAGGRGVVFLITVKADGNSFLSFCSGAGAKAAWGELVTPLHMVTYSVEPLSDGSKALFRGEEPIVASDDAYYDRPILVAANVMSFTVEAYDGAEWEDRWPGEGTGVVPVLIAVTLVIDDGTEAGRAVFVECAPPVEYEVPLDAEAETPTADRKEQPGADGESASVSRGERL